MHTNERKIKVLYIDDESNNLLSFQAGFRRIYTVYTAGSAVEGMQVLNETPDINVIIADQRMPQSTGVDFFNIIRTSHPHPVRILLTGYTDAEAIIDAINKGEIYRYIKKPWNEIELRNAISNAYEMYVTRQQLRRKVAELEKTNDELNRFVYSTSHDLRSPLASIMGILNLWKMETAGETPNNYMGMIETCVNRMDVFIQKIIEYYKSIRVEDERVPIDFRTTIAESIEICKMQRPDITYSLRVDQPTEFISDAFRVSVIVDNLISNATKYQKPSGEDPSVDITVKVTEESAQVEIEDNGIGILEEHLQNIFKMFFRSYTNVNSLGIGLHIVKEALTRIGGDITVRSVYGKGSVFCLTIPNHSKPRQ